MKCFAHPNADAVAVCKHCTKGLCAACARENEAGTTCGDPCAEHVAVAHAMLVRSKALVGASTSSLRGTGLFLVVCGLVIGASGMSLDTGYLVVIGIVFVVFGIAAYWITRAMRPAE